MLIFVETPPWLLEQTFAGETVRDRWTRLLGARGYEPVFESPADEATRIDGSMLDADVSVLLEGGADRTIDDVHALNQREAAYYRQRAEDLSASGVRIIGGFEQVRVSDAAHVEPGATLWSDVTVLGECHVAAGATIQSNCYLRDTTVAAGAVLKMGTYADGAVIGERVHIGPFAHLREGTVLETGSKVGNFVETKKTTLGPGAKANHLTYLGNATVGAKSNIGAGTITCNYDGARKHPTVIGEGVFVGTQSALVAPLEIGDGALIAAGAVVTKDVEPGTLVVARAPQKDIPGKGAEILERNRRLKREADG